MTEQELQQLVSLGESNSLEFKRTTGLKIEAAKSMCGMLNGVGGYVLFGVSDSGNIAGQDVSDHTRQEVVLEFRRFEPPAFPEIDTVRLANGRSVLAVRVSAGNSKPYTYDGRPYVKNGPTTSIMPQPEYERLLIERLHATRRWENEPVPPEIGLNDLDADEVKRVIDTAVRVGRLQRPRNEGLEDLLRGLGVMNDGRLVNAAIALFGRGDRVRSLYPQLSLRVARFRGTDRLADFADNRQFWGHGFALLGHAETFLLDHIPIAGRVLPGKLRREDRPAYPPRATREALANAICHRDYTAPGGAVTVALYNDHLEFSNPGGLHFGLSPEKLVQPHESKPWNPIIADVFYKADIIEQWGMGTLNISEWCRENENPAPSWTEQSGAVTLAFRPAAPLRQESGLESGQESRQESGPESETEALSQRIIRLLKRVPLSRSAIAKQLGHKSVSGALNRTLRGMFDDGLIEYTLPDKPQSRLQKYRLTPKGNSTLE